MDRGKHDGVTDESRKMVRLSLKVLILDSIIIGRQGANCCDTSVESQTPFIIGKVPTVPKVILKKKL